MLLAVSTTVQAAETPLANAVERADWEQVRQLIEQDVDPNTPQVDGMTALHWAAWHDHTETARFVRQRMCTVSAHFFIAY